MTPFVPFTWEGFLHAHDTDRPYGSQDLAREGIEIRSHYANDTHTKTYEVIHRPSMGSVEVREQDLLDECDRVGAKTVYERRAVLMKMVRKVLQEMADRKRLQPGGTDGQEEGR